MDAAVWSVLSEVDTSVLTLRKLIAGSESLIIFSTLPEASRFLAAAGITSHAHTHTLAPLRAQTCPVGANQRVEKNLFTKRRREEIFTGFLTGC